MKQTAVEWLFNNLNISGGSDDMKAFEQAKAMDKEQKIEFANNYGFDICGYDYEKAEQYYNETYESKTNL